MGLRLFDIFLLPSEQIIGKKVEFTVKAVDVKDSEAIITFEEVPTMQIRIGSKVETKSWSRKKRI
jgi:hypothetical protein